MRDKIEAYVNELFRNAPDNPQTRELKEEILGNTLDKYEEQVSSGKDDKTAYQFAISGIGDVDELIKEYAGDSGEIIEAESTPVVVTEPETSEKQKPSLQKIVVAIMWCLIFVVYLVISFTTGAWKFTWVTFLIGFAVKFVIDGIFELINQKQ
ncbi:MAG: permease prefix domain 1-containing protein [Oscillospiraceae bacterium]|nr:permease prefix domain 1-containing protein [Oscillospiraceae bacterium]